MPKTKQEDFKAAVLHWGDAATEHATCEEVYRMAHAKAYVAATGSHDLRKATADAATGQHRTERNEAEIVERRAYHTMIFLRGSAGEAERT